MASETEAQERRINLQAKHQRAKRPKVRCKPLSALDEDNYAPIRFDKSDEIRVFLTKSLRANFIFDNLTESELVLLVDAFQQYTVSANSIIILQGASDIEYFYVLQSGVVKFLVDGEEVMRLDEPGSAFGELELLHEFPRAATCQAVQPCVLWRVDQQTFRLILARRAKEQEQIQFDLLKKIPILKDQSLDHHTLENFVQAFTTVTFQKGDPIIAKGDLGEVFYIIIEGAVTVTDIGTGTSVMMDQTLTQGDWFGELELVTGEPRVATVTAATDTVVTAAMSKEDFLRFAGPMQHLLEKEAKKRFLKALPIFANSDFSDDEFRLLVDNLEERAWGKGEEIYNGSKTPDQRCLWIIHEGHVILSDGTIRHHLKRGDYFGDKWISESKRNPENSGISVANALATCAKDATCWILDRDDIQEVVGDIMRLGAPIAYQYPVLDPTIRLENLEKICILGKGEFAVVWAVRDKETQKTYALKCLSKVHLLEHPTDAVTATRHEKEIMICLNHPLIIRMYASFQDPQYVYLLLPLFQGGELYSIIYKDDGTDRYGIKDIASVVFYSACIVEALSYMHKRSVIYRDLKPDNVLIDARGYAVLIDMGLAKLCVGKTFSMAGTPAYVSPEVLIGRGHHRGADFWSLGVVLYEMLDGHTPFDWGGACQRDIFQAILNCDYKCPEYFPEAAKDLIDRLLVKDDSERLGTNSPRGHLDICDHAWFDSMSFKSLRRGELQAPWTPKVKDPSDTSNFAKYNPVDLESPYRAVSDAEQLEFYGF